MSDLDTRDALESAVMSVLWNARNYPECVQSRILGQDMGPLAARVTDAVLAKFLAAHDAETVRVTAEKAAQEAMDFWAACGELVDSNSTAELAFEGAANRVYCMFGLAPDEQRADHPHTDPGDGRTQCPTCGKYVWPSTHSCKGIRVAPDEKGGA